MVAVRWYLRFGLSRMGGPVPLGERNRPTPTLTAEPGGGALDAGPGPSAGYPSVNRKNRGR